MKEQPDLVANQSAVWKNSNECQTRYLPLANEWNGIGTGRRKKEKKEKDEALLLLT